MSEVVFVGTSDAFGAGGRRQAAILARGPGGAVLLDCGGTTVSGLAALGIARDEIDAVAISHFHGDHYAGIPQLLLAALYEDERRRPLVIAGPVGVELRVRTLSRAHGYALEEREWPFPIRFVELPAGRPVPVGPGEITAFPTHHQADVCPHGLDLRLGSRRVVYSGDTGWFDELPARARGAELFICECTLFEKNFEYHLSFEEISRRIDAFDCQRMILTHLGPDMCERRGSLEVETADDGLKLLLAPG
jgi:ribonuclease BN (tRNA processing enzyme)